MSIRVLLLAEAANPEWVSVPLVGWSFFNALREIVDVHLVTQVRNRDAILRAGLTEGRDFTAIDTERLERPLWRLGKVLRLGWTSKMAINALSYPYFERLVWARFGAAIQAGEFDIVHRVTPLSPTINSPIAVRCAKAGVPFVLGPLNGGLPWPREFDAARRKEKEWLTYLRGAYRLLPGRKGMFASTSAILVGSRHTASEIPAAYGDRVTYLPENGIDPSRFGLTAERPSIPPLRACFVGRLVPYKGPDIVLEAAQHHLRAGTLVLDMVGDGPMMAELKAKIETLGVADSVRMYGWVAHDKVPSILGKAHILAFPSIREFGGGVVLEAMALGVTPLVVNYGGPGELVAGGHGIAIPLARRDRIVDDLSTALDDILAAPEDFLLPAADLEQHALSGFSWAGKAAKLKTIYSSI